MQLSELKGKITDRWTVQFEWYGDFDNTMHRSISVKELIDDWREEASFCPENGTYLYNILLGDNMGRVFLIDEVDREHSPSEPITFERLMEVIEDREER